MREEIKKYKGITLISLVITIIILLLLAGISIAQITGNGLFEKAKLAKERTDKVQLLENSILEEYQSEINVKNLPENTKDTDAGTEVRMPEEWYTSVPSEVSTSNGAEVERVKKVANVYAVSDGTGETVPIPYGFYYVGGTIATGVVISDNENDKNKYVNFENTEEVPEGIPTGVAYNEDGTVDEEKSDLKGNQFVWIPSRVDDYKKVNFGVSGASGWDMSTNTAEIVQIEKYGGFYVARYEAGTSNIKLLKDVEFGNISTSSSWQNESFKLSNVESGKITSKAGEIPYYHADYGTAVEMSKLMYNSSTSSVQSGLMTGTMWDVMMKFITSDITSYSDLKSTPWGNYDSSNSSVNYKLGQGRYMTINSSTGSVTSNAIVSDTSYHYGIRTTASTEDVKKNNLYDIAGNLYEWTQEYANNSNSINLYMRRGGSLASSYSRGCVCVRSHANVNNTYTYDGFRPALYIK